ncbi:[protein-PII] uridylyltransferase [Methylicorpusculum sp.]|uniref:[protein-PII] uridylyltransferase n=1 Tax=Methylicorpusculum sp. TaxID=2713644 RepID=UPI002AB83F88|nr:[protein-PII] uridylyltransferase [Methylicorpusculum sp.]MDZ4151021.1 [protein-PII] uridylyltransferase [Methylicorpusculum sp.]
MTCPDISPELFNQPDCIARFKQIIKNKNATLKQDFVPQSPVAHLLIEKADFVDHLLVCSWLHYLTAAAKDLSLIAVGGYGRKELFPYSDIDIVILLPPDSAPDIQDRLTIFCNFLWDIGLKPGLSVRTVEECIQAAKDDQTVMTSLLETRLISGSQKLYEKVLEPIKKKEIWPSAEFFPAKLLEQEQRYFKSHDTAYNLEPNIKEGPGGLRDMQIIAWVFKRHYNSTTLKELIKYDFLPESEYDELISLRSTLWSIRYALQLLTGRDENRLLFDFQHDLSIQFGFIDANINHGVEQFMQYYYKTVVGLERLNEMLLQLFNERFLCTETTYQYINTRDSKLIVINGYLEAENEQLFEINPLALLEIFLILQQNISLKGIRAKTIRLIRKSLHLIDDTFRKDKNANHLFIEILRQPQGITHELRRMNRYGVLAAYLPSFAHIVARMQYDLFHVYTVDEHTLFVIRNLRRFSLDKHINELPFCNDVYLMIGKPELLYIAALFHDIAKGMGGDHSTIGEDIAREFCIQHDLSKHDIKLVTWLVRNHLIMSMTAQRKDISDPEIIHEFAQCVGSIEYLNYLYLLTVADIRATNPELWNSWKDALLKELYNATYSALHRGLKVPINIHDRLEETKNEALEELIKLGLTREHVLASWKHASDDYFLRYSVDEITWHTIAISSCDEKDLPLVLLRPQTQRGSAEVFVYTHNENHIFSISTETLDQLGLTILDARIVTTHDQYVLNSFQILEQTGEPIIDLYREIHICSSLRKNLKEHTINKQKNIRRQSRQARHFPIPTTVFFHEDPLHKCTILELITTDHAGLLSTIGQIFNRNDIRLHDAKITTIGSRAEDMFYITDDQTKPIRNMKQLAKLENDIINSLRSIN